MKKVKAKRQSGNVFEALGFSPEESHVLALKAQLAALIVRVVRERGLSQKELGGLWGVPQPRVSEVMTGKLAVIGTDRLVEFLAALGVEISVRAKTARGARRKAG